MERKYLIPDEKSFNDILDFIPRPPETMGDYVVRASETKTRNYRYFDTFDARLEEKGLLAYLGQGSLEKGGISASLRAREDDFVFTIKIPTGDPTTRDEYQQRIVPSEGTNFYAIRPEDFSSWDALKKIRKIMSEDDVLQETVRLEVLTNRFDLYHERQLRAEVAVDQVTARGMGRLQCKFYELEVEARENGNEADIIAISELFNQNQEGKLLPSQTPKWIKALKLMRGEKIEPDKP